MGPTQLTNRDCIQNRLLARSNALLCVAGGRTAPLFPDLPDARRRVLLHADYAVDENTAQPVLHRLVLGRFDAERRGCLHEFAARPRTLLVDPLHFELPHVLVGDHLSLVPARNDDLLLYLALELDDWLLDLFRRRVLLRRHLTDRKGVLQP